jgi:hypothetical protein
MARGQRRLAKKAISTTTAYSKLSAADHTAIRRHLKRRYGRVADSEVAAWRFAGKS